jgi:hypothetical protein
MFGKQGRGQEGEEGSSYIKELDAKVFFEDCK